MKKVQSKISQMIAGFIFGTIFVSTIYAQEKVSARETANVLVPGIIKKIAELYECYENHVVDDEEIKLMAKARVLKINRSAGALNVVTRAQVEKEKESLLTAFYKRIKGHRKSYSVKLVESNEEFADKYLDYKFHDYGRSMKISSNMLIQTVNAIASIECDDESDEE